MSYPQKLVVFSFLLTSILLPLQARAVDHFVTDDGEFGDALDVVQPGDTITWQNGVYDDLDTLRFEPVTNGTAASPFALKRQGV